MLSERNPVLLAVIGVVLALALIVSGQFLANASAPPVKQSSQGAIIGQAGFAYIGGLRMMAAGLLWGRLDAQFHQYSGLSKIQDRLDLLPSIRIVQLLNPQLEQPYYFTSYVLYLRGRMSDALALAREGIRQNPTSGLLRASYAQLLIIQDAKHNLPLMLEQAKAGLSKTAVYNNADDEYEAFGVFRVVYGLAGDQKMVKALRDGQAALDAQRATPGSSGGGFMGLVNGWANAAVPTPDNGAAANATSTAVVK